MVCQNDGIQEWQTKVKQYDPDIFVAAGPLKGI